MLIKKYLTHWEGCVIHINAYSDTNRYGELTEKEVTESGFYKISHCGGSYVTAGFYNPITNEYFSKCIRDYDYADCSRDNDDLYYMEINETVARKYSHVCGKILVGDYVEVFKGRKVPIGYIGKVAKFYDWRDCYGRVQTTYVVFEDGQKTNVFNCRLHKAMD